MMRLIRVLSALACAVALAPVPALAQTEQAPLVLAGGTVIDLTNWGESARDIPNAVVIIREGRIAEVGPAAKPAAAGAAAAAAAREQEA